MTDRVPFVRRPLPPGVSEPGAPPTRYERLAMRIRAGNEARHVATGPSGFTGRQERFLARAWERWGREST